MKKKAQAGPFIEAVFQLFGSLGPEIRMKLPANWTQDPMPGLSVPGANAVFRPVKTPSLIFSPYLALFSHTVNPRMKVRDYRKLRVLDLKDKVAGFRLKSERRTKLAGFPAFKLVFESKVRGIDIKWFQVMAVGKEAVYYFTYGQDVKGFSCGSREALVLLNRTVIMEKGRLKLPGNAYVMKLVSRTDRLLLRALKKKKLSLVYSSMDPDFKKQWPLSSFIARFADYWEKKDIMDALAFARMVFEYPPAIDLSNHLSVSVYYGSGGRELHLFHLYSYRNRKWTLFNLIPSIRNSSGVSS